MLRLTADRDRQATTGAGHDAATGPFAEVSPARRYGARSGSTLAVVVVWLLLAARVSSVAAAGAYSQIPFTVSLFVLPALYIARATRPLVLRHQWMTLAVQAVLTAVPFAIFGSSWQTGIDGLLAGLVLLVLSGWTSWLLAGALLAAELAARATLPAPPPSPAWYNVVVAAAYYIDDALVIFALVRLAQIVDEVADAQGTAASLAVATERLEAARSLRTAVGERVAEISSKIAAARRELRADAALARALVAEAGIAARDAAGRAREVSARHLDVRSRRPASPLTGSAVIGARMAWAVLVGVLSVIAIENIGYVATSHYRDRLATIAIGIIAAAIALQLYHSSAARHGRKARWWPLSLAVQTVLAYAFLLPFVHAYTGFLGPLVAGSALLLIPGWWRWAGYGLIVASYSVLYALSLPAAANAGHQLLPNIGYAAADSAELGLLVYGLAWLASLAVQLEEVTHQLAQMAVVQERLRIARDVHDLLGLGLSAIALKADLVDRLIASDQDRADAEIGELVRICATARAEIQLVTGDGQRLSLAAELAVARQILASAGIEVRATITGEEYLATGDDVLAPVLREAVTNILRHSSARSCVIEAVASAAAVRLRIMNDGVTGPAPAPQGTGPGQSGRGLINLAARLAAAGGRFTSGSADGSFDLCAELPARVTLPTR
jgi:two-component system, NarL family, sensor histidine kinase DesK